MLRQIAVLLLLATVALAQPTLPATPPTTSEAAHPSALTFDSPANVPSHPVALLRQCPEFMEINTTEPRSPSAVGALLVLGNRTLTL
jgi:hypothetical protein